MSTVQEMMAKFDRYSIEQRETKAALNQVLNKLATHDEEHKAIERHMDDVRKSLWGPQGLADQANDCRNYRENAKEFRVALDKNTTLTQQVNNKLSAIEGEALGNKRAGTSLVGWVTAIAAIAAFVIGGIELVFKLAGHH